MLDCLINFRFVKKCLINYNYCLKFLHLLLKINKLFLLKKEKEKKKESKL